MMNVDDDQFLASLQCNALPSVNEVFNSISFKAEDPEKFPYHVKIFFTEESIKDPDNERQLKIYQKVSICSRVIKKSLAATHTFFENINWDIRVLTGKFSQCTVWIIISSFFDQNLEDLMEACILERRLMTPKRITLQIQTAQVLFIDLRDHLHAKLKHPSLNARNFFFIVGRTFSLPGKFGMPNTEQISNILNNRPPCKDEEVENGFKSSIFSIGLLMAYSLSIIPISELPQLQKVLQDGSQIDMDILYKMAPIMYYSKSLRNLIRKMLNVNKWDENQDNFSEMVEDWGELFCDFQLDTVQSLAERISKNMDNGGTYVKLKVIPVAVKTYEMLKSELLAIEEKVDLADLLQEIQQNAGMDSSLKFENLESLFVFLKEKEPWLLASLFYGLRSYYSSTILSKITETVRELWMKEIVGFKFQGSNKIGDIFKGENSYENSAPLFILLPRIKNLDRAKSNYFGPIEPKADIQFFQQIYNHIEKKIIHSADIPTSPHFLWEELQAHEEIKSLVAAEIRLEVWIIQMDIEGPTLRDYLNQQNSQNTKKRNKIIHNLIELTRELKPGHEIHGNFLPENIYFQSYYRGEFKLPLLVKGTSLTSTSNEEKESFSKIYIAPEGNCNIYTLGMMLAQILLLDEFDNIFVNGNECLMEKLTKLKQLLELLLTYSGSYADLISTIMKSIDLNPLARFSEKDLYNLHLNSIGLAPSVKIPDEFKIGLLGFDMHIIGIARDDLIAKRVLNELKDDILALDTSQFNFKEFTDEIKDLLQQLEIDDKYDLLEDETFTDIGSLVDFLLDNDMIFYDTFFKFLLLGIDHFNRDKGFKEKLLTLLQDLWLLDFSNLEIIGNGAFGVVLRSLHPQEEDKGACALKIIIPSSEKEVKYAREEIEHLKTLEHPNIATLSDYLEEKVLSEVELRRIMNYEDYISEDMTESDLSGTKSAMAHLIIRSRESSVTSFIITMDLEGPTLKQWLKETFDARKNSNDKLWKTQLKIIRGLIRGAKYLQHKKLLHCDLKPDNILFKLREPFDEDEYNFPIKLVDFGLSRIKPNENLEILSGRGNRRYQAPEIFRGEPYGFEAEIYSIGVIILEVLLPIKEGEPLGLILNEFNRIQVEEDDSDERERPVQSLFIALQKMIKAKQCDRMTLDEFKKLDFDWISFNSSHQSDYKHWLLLKALNL